MGCWAKPPITLKIFTNIPCIIVPYFENYFPIARQEHEQHFNIIFNILISILSINLVFQNISLE